MLVLWLLADPPGAVVVVVVSGLSCGCDTMAVAAPGRGRALALRLGFSSSAAPRRLDLVFTVNTPLAATAAAMDLRLRAS